MNKSTVKGLVLSSVLLQYSAIASATISLGQAANENLTLTDTNVAFVAGNKEVPALAQID